MEQNKNFICVNCKLVVSELPQQCWDCGHTTFTETLATPTEKNNPDTVVSENFENIMQGVDPNEGWEKEPLDNSTEEVEFVEGNQVGSFEYYKERSEFWYESNNIERKLSNSYLNDAIKLKQENESLQAEHKEQLSLLGLYIQKIEASNKELLEALTEAKNYVPERDHGQGESYPNETYEIIQTAISNAKNNSK